MMTRYRVNLNAQGLQDIDPVIIIHDVSYTAPQYQTVTSMIAGRHGLRRQSRKAQSSSVTVSFEIHERDVRRRHAVCQKVQAWAKKGGFLTVNDRPGQRLRVVCENMPVIESAMRWTEKLRIEFVAYEFPFWEDERETVVSVASGSTAQFYVRGTAEKTDVSVQVRNTGSATINTMTIRAGDTFMTFKSLGLAAGKTLDIGYDDAGFLFIRADGVSKLDKRTGDSSDDLTAACGEMNSVSVTADGSALATFRVRGRYL